MPLSDGVNKVCSRCGATQLNNAFYKNRTARDGLQRHCIVCMKETRLPENNRYHPEHYKKWYEANREKKIAAVAKRRAVKV